ncbi:tautomerase family protein (plasmid) [Agrobacterium rosae]|uniref:Tautomerase family protein n=1 Tax=Agrobacterium rosae TaxID=1972867 RepID=A0ABU4W4T4_9HYPH|nr:tautomerase family protein [Agrobacterium rosae]MDX8331770.1 tautomerase family protein [Agrobacterium rosae]
MPHIIMKIAIGKSDAEKIELAQALTAAVISTIMCDERFVSVAIEDVEVADWMEKVYQPEIVSKSGLIYKQPEYDPE